MKKTKFEDDGRTIVKMDFDDYKRPFSFHPRVTKKPDKNNNFNNINLTKKERKAMVLGGMLAILPIAFIFGFLYFLALLLLDLFWLR